MSHQEKRGWKGPMRRATKQVQKALEAQRRREAKASKGQRAQNRNKSNAPKYPSRDTREIAPRAPAPASERMFSAADLGAGLRGMSLGGAALAGGLGATALASGQFNRRSGNNPNPGFAPETGGVPGGRRLPPPISNPGKSQTGSDSNHQTTIIEAPVIIGVQKRGHAPKMWARSQKGDVEVTVEHCEYISDLKAVGDGSFPGASPGVPRQFFANPGLAASFPWLSSLAANFDEYKFDYLELHYEPLVGTNSGGKFLATFDPDVLDEYPDTKQDMLQARVQLDSPIWTRSIIKVPKDLLEQFLFIRPGAVPAGADQHVYDAGVFNLAVPGPVSGSVGELFVMYKCRLRTPNGGNKYFEGYEAFVGVAAGSPAGTSAGALSGNIGITWVNTNSFRIDMPGIYYLQLTCGGTGFTGPATLNAPVAPNSLGLGPSTSSAVGTITNYEVTNTDPTQAWVISQPPGTATLTSCSVRVFAHDIDLNP